MASPVWHKFTHRFDIEAVKKAKNGIFSSTSLHRGIPLHLRMQFVADKTTPADENVEVTLYINDGDSNKFWSIIHDTHIKWKDHNNAENSLLFKQSRDYCESHKSVRCVKKLLELRNNHQHVLENDKYITVEVNMRVIRLVALSVPTGEYDFSPSDKNKETIILNFDKGASLKLGRATLAQCSEYFQTVIYNGTYRDCRQPTHDVPDVDVEEFKELLRVVYPPHKRVTFDSYKYIVKLSRRFLMPIGVNAAESFVIHADPVRFKTHEKIELADKYHLEKLLVASLNDYNSINLVKSIEGSKHYRDFADSTVAAVGKRLIEFLRNKSSYY